MIWPALGGDVWLLLAVALLLDGWLGEPAWLWSRLRHPAAMMGAAVAWLEAQLNQGGARRLKGLLALILLLTVVGALAWGVQATPVVGPTLAVVGAAVLLAQRSLVVHVEAVAHGLDKGLEPGRKAVSMIVGRDPAALDESGVARAAIESCAENFSDGVVAPAFWFLVGGLPGVALYKAINTADSMIGHRTERLEAFGWAAARLDDLVNLIPARLSGLLIAASAWSRPALKVMLRDARLHNSPNAGWPEAATAGALGVALAGPRLYGGRLTEAPFLNVEGRREPGAEEIRAATGLIARAWIALVSLMLLAATAETLFDQLQ